MENIKNIKNIKQRIHDLYEQKQAISNEIYELQREEIKQELEENRKKWVGRYFKEEKADNIKYIKVVNEHADSVYRITALVFYEKIKYDFEINDYLEIIYRDKIMGKFKSNFIGLKSIYITDLHGYEEITKEEYDIAAGDFLNNLLETEFKVIDK